MAAPELPGITTLTTPAEALVAASGADRAVDTLPELDAFVDMVLCDGRDVHSFQENPQEAAARLGIVLTPAIAHELSATTRGELLARVSQAKLNSARTRSQQHSVFAAVMEPGTATIVFVVVAIVLIGIVYIIYDKAQEGKVTDNSPDKDNKL